MDTQNSPRGGRLTAEERDPTLRCTWTSAHDGRQCGNYRAAGSDSQRCWFHGGATKALAESKHQALVDKATTYAGIVEQVKPSDLPQVLAEYVARLNRVFALLEVELDEQRLLMGEIELNREYADVLGYQQRTALVVSKLAETVAKLNLSYGLRNPDEAFADIDLDEVRRETLELVSDYTVSTPDGVVQTCWSCGQAIGGAE